jgi:transporter family-2 protein
MKSVLLCFLAGLGGVFLAIQAGFNSQLGAILRQPVLAVVSTSLASAVFGIVFLLIFGRETFPAQNFTDVPWYLWFIGGLFSMAGISLYFYTIPQMGISKMIAIGLCGQLVFSLVAGKFGWLNLPVEPIGIKRLAGSVMMIIGILLINSK